MASKNLGFVGFSTSCQAIAGMTAPRDAAVFRGNVRFSATARK